LGGGETNHKTGGLARGKESNLKAKSLSSSAINGTFRRRAKKRGGGWGARGNHDVLGGRTHQEHHRGEGVRADKGN